MALAQKLIRALIQYAGDALYVVPGEQVLMRQGEAERPISARVITRSQVEALYEELASPSIDTRAQGVQEFDYEDAKGAIHVIAERKGTKLKLTLHPEAITSLSSLSIGQGQAFPSPSESLVPPSMSRMGGPMDIPANDRPRLQGRPRPKPKEMETTIRKALQDPTPIPKAKPARPRTPRASSAHAAAMAAPAAKELNLTEIFADATVSDAFFSPGRAIAQRQNGRLVQSGTQCTPSLLTKLEERLELSTQTAELKIHQLSGLRLKSWRNLALAGPALTLSRIPETTHSLDDLGIPEIFIDAFQHPSRALSHQQPPWRWPNPSGLEPRPGSAAQRHQGLDPGGGCRNPY